MKPITELDVQGLDGEFYADTRKYLEKRGCVWSEQRGREGELLSVHLAFPPGTTYRELPGGDLYDRHQIEFKEGGILYWAFRKTEKINSIAVPYAYL